MMAWVVVFHELFDAEFLALPRDVQTALAARARLLESVGRGRGAVLPRADRGGG